MKDDDHIEKATKPEWRDVHTKYGVHQQRYHVSTDVGEERKKHPFGGDTASSAALKDAVFYGIKYNGRYYDSKGDRIPLNKEQEQYANKLYDEKGRLTEGKPPAGMTQEEWDKGNKKIALEKRDRLMPIINEKEELYKEELEKLNKRAKKLYQDINYLKNTILTPLTGLDFYENPQLIAKVLSGIDNKLKTKRLKDLSADITIQYKGKEHKIKRNIQDFVDSLSNMSKDDKISIKDFKIKELDKLDIEDFKEAPVYNTNEYLQGAWESAVKKYNKKHGK